MSPDSQKKVVKGALMYVGSNSRRSVIDSNTNVFVFQYNPNMLTRTLAYPDQDTSMDDKKLPLAQRTPIDVICLMLELDATNQLEAPEKHKTIVENGLHPSIAVLESMMYPQSRRRMQEEPPIVLFFWGPKRIIPVRLMSLKVFEEAFDQKLNPIRAKIDLCMRVVECSELRKESLAYEICTRHLSQNSSLASLYRESSLDQADLRTILSYIHQPSKKKSGVKNPNKPE